MQGTVSAVSSMLQATRARSQVWPHRLHHAYLKGPGCEAGIRNIQFWLPGSCCAPYPATASRAPAQRRISSLPSLSLQDRVVCLSSRGWRGVLSPFCKAAFWDIPLPTFLQGSAGILPVSCHLEARALPRKLGCLIWHHAFLSGAGHKVLTYSTAEQQAFMNRALNSAQLQEARNIRSHLITSLTTSLGSQRTVSQHLLTGFLKKHVFAEVQFD